MVNNDAVLALVRTLCNQNFGTSKESVVMVLAVKKRICLINVKEVIICILNSTNVVVRIPTFDQPMEGVNQLLLMPLLSALKCVRTHYSSLFYR